MTEYWVTVRERGSYEEEHEVAELHKSTTKASSSISVLAIFFVEKRI